ncbi:glycosyltransferase [Roseomonas sp. E05]|uniref:glycosyltransferase n=1 Tax=Roseomonas sp. E05 TaxID=3046310 RepID=UPI0024BAD573|nr:glycosyltransferase [Roseomonas sp. E05]MDJ0391462.1 glycosyltransferase [Roseomonas sp. E05]
MPPTTDAAPPPAGKLLFLATHSAAGGVQEVTANIAEGLAGRGFDIRFAALYPHARTVPAGSGRFPWLHVVPRRPRTPLGGAGLLRALVRLLRRERPAAVLTSMPLANVLGPLAATLAGTGTRVVVAHHVPVSAYGAFPRLLDGFTGRLPAVHAIVSVSHTVQASLATRPPAYRRKCQTIHNTLPPRLEQHARDLSSRHDRAAAHRRKLVAVGRLEPQKNFPALIQALAQMPDTQAEILGHGPEAEALQDLTRRLGVAARLGFAGQKSREEVLAILSEADVFVQPSLFEGHSLSLIEASKLALPLVVSDVPAQVEGVTAPDGTRCGLVVGPQDAAGLVAALRRLLDDPAHYRHWSARSRLLASSNAFASQLAAYEALVLAAGEQAAIVPAMAGGRRLAPLRPDYGVPAGKGD